MSGQWRVTVDSWISDDADWYGRRVFLVDGARVHSLRAALRHVAELPAEQLLVPEAQIRKGRPPNKVRR